MSLMADASIAPIKQLHPFRIEPKFVGRVWGYQDLRPWYDRVAQGEPLGEVWLTGDDCIIATGAHAGQTLGSLFAAEPEAMLGAAATSPGSPLLVKMIFAREKLSVQVHPDDKMAQKYGEPRGKTECWYALSAQAGAQVAAGVKPGVTLDQIRAGIHDGTLEESLNMLKVSPGDMIYVDAGTVHAIWPGSILLETQQNSDTTYRMFDYGRPRELHIEKSLEATRLVTHAGKVQPIELTDRTVLIDVENFRVERIPVAASRMSRTLPAKGEAPNGLSYLFACYGEGRLIGADFNPVDLPARGVVAVPASAPSFVIQDQGELDLLRIAPNWPARSA
jgi:mannose-6-phosphate isomerase